MDVAYFKPLKVMWRKTLLEWKFKNQGVISKDVFPSLLKKCLDLMNVNKTKMNVMAGFKGFRIPFDKMKY